MKRSSERVAEENKGGKEMLSDSETTMLWNVDEKNIVKKSEGMAGKKKAGKEQMQKHAIKLQQRKARKDSRKAWKMSTRRDSLVYPQENKLGVEIQRSVRRHEGIIREIIFFITLKNKVCHL